MLFTYLVWTVGLLQLVSAHSWQAHTRDNAEDSLIVIDEKSCSRPVPHRRDIGLSTVLKVKNEALNLATMVRDQMVAGAADTESEAGRRTALIVKTLFATDAKSPLYSKALDYLSRVEKTKVKIYCSDKHIPRAHRACTDADGAMARPWMNSIVICPSTWKNLAAKGRLVLNYKTPSGPDMTGQEFDDLKTASTVLFHELLHIATWSRERENYDIIDVSTNGNFFLQAYGPHNCIRCASDDILAQKQWQEGFYPWTDDDVDPLESYRHMAIEDVATKAIEETKEGLSNKLPGLAIHNADNYVYVAIQMYYLQNEFMSTMEGINYNVNGFSLDKLVYAWQFL